MSRTRFHVPSSFALPALSLALVLAAGLTLGSWHPAAQAGGGMTVDEVMAKP